MYNAREVLGPLADKLLIVTALIASFQQEDSRVDGCCHRWKGNSGDRIERNRGVAGDGHRGEHPGEVQNGLRVASIFLLIMKGGSPTSISTTLGWCSCGSHGLAVLSGIDYSGDSSKRSSSESNA